MLTVHLPHKMITRASLQRIKDVKSSLLLRTTQRNAESNCQTISSQLACRFSHENSRRFTKWPAATAHAEFYDTASSSNFQDYLKQTLEEDEERHGEKPRDRDTGEKIENPADGPKEGEEVKEDEKEKKKKDDDTDTDDDDSGSGGILMPVIEWIGKLFPRVAGEPKS